MVYNIIYLQKNNEYQTLNMTFYLPKHILYCIHLGVKTLTCMLISLYKWYFISKKRLDSAVTTNNIRESKEIYFSKFQ